jgi:hypothetical protein
MQHIDEQVKRRLANAAQDVLDTLTPMLGWGWTTGDLDTRRVNGHRVATELSRAVMAGEKAPPSHAALDPAEWTAAANRSFDRLDHVLAKENLRWSGTRATAERTELERGRLTLLDAGGQAEHVFDIDQKIARGQLLNDEYMSVLDSHQQGVRARNEQLDRRLNKLAGFGYGVEREQPFVEFRFEERRPVQCSAQVLGSWSEEERTWCWAWANRTFDDVERKQARMLRDEMISCVGTGAFWRAGFFCDEAFAANLADLSVGLLDGAACVPGRHGGLVTYYLLGEMPDLR